MSKQQGRKITNSPPGKAPRTPERGPLWDAIKALPRKKARREASLTMSYDDAVTAAEAFTVGDFAVHPAA